MTIFREKNGEQRLFLKNFVQKKGAKTTKKFKLDLKFFKLIDFHWRMTNNKSQSSFTTVYKASFGSF